MKLKDQDTAPEKQADDVNLEDALGAEFDRMEASGEADDSGVEHEEVEILEEGDEEVVEAAAEGSEEDEVVDDSATETDEEELGYNQAAPERWPDDIKEAYNALPPEAREVMLERVFKPMQRSFTEKTQAMAQMRKQLDPMMDIMNRHSKNFEHAGVDPIQALNRQMEWSAHFARVGNEQGAKDLATAYGQVAGQEDTNAYLTPIEKRQQAQIDRMEQQLNTNAQNEQTRVQQADQSAVNARTQDVRNNIQQFASETRNGKPTHPHVEQVSAQMAGLINGGLVERTDEYGQPVPYQDQLGQAYKMACSMSPSLRSAQDIVTRQEQVRRASAANREVVSKTPGSDVKIDDTAPLADSISDLYDKLDRSVA
ncbi:MAG: hypothetical protein DRI24_14545 [Deltaproteobacteria bacterium]|nr:MAG: hypothetical protein DRI24_14545 [Deltaproteobacteria bacterium]